MVRPLALIFYENLLPGSQLVNRLQDIGYRVLNVSDARLLEDTALREKPMVVVVDLVAQRADICAEIAALRKNPETKHLPILAFGSDKNRRSHDSAKSAGATLVASDAGILDQLPHLLEQVLQID